jgi:hypothetical protein
MQRLRYPVRREQRDMWQAQRSGFCVTMTHRHTYRMMCTDFLHRNILWSSNYLNLRISFRMTSGCSILSNWATAGHVKQTWRTSHRNWQLSSGGLKNPSARASKNNMMDGAIVYVCVGGGWTHALDPIWNYQYSGNFLTPLHKLGCNVNSSTSVWRAAPGSALAEALVLHVGRSQVRGPMKWLNFAYFSIICRTRTWSYDSH